ncbi:hypothetical protein ACFWC5_23685 [Streptomyces sp. NPDC060085]|uniref:hypothetical protein n=1 Tax=Streptomyces sp. NPDC060085 TaxID=3347054 RepID=UPI003647FCB9
MAESEREYIRGKSLEGQASARDRRGGRPEVFDDDMSNYARTLRTNGGGVARGGTTHTVKAPG